MNINFTGKTAFITGAGNGIGRAAALAFAKHGANVAAFDLNEQNNKETVYRIEAAGGRGLALTGSVAESKDVKKALDLTVGRFGHLDFAFNNAGIEQPVRPLTEISEKEWEGLVNTNLRGVFLCMKFQIPLMLQQGAGAIVNTSSGAGVAGFAGQAGYSATKFGIIGLSKCAALDYVDSNIRINVLCPGMTDTDMIFRFTGGTAEGRARAIAQEPIGRMATPEEMASIVLWLCSDSAAFIVGQTIVADGGQTVGLGKEKAVL